MAFVDIRAASYSAEKNEVIIEGIDLDDVLLNDWNQEFSDEVERVFRFDLSMRGARVYLYKLLKSVIKKDCHSMEEMVLALPGVITNISSNFLATAEG